MTEQLAKLEQLTKVAGQPKLAKDYFSILCPGCGHGITWQLIARSIEDLGLRGKAIGLTGAGCNAAIGQVGGWDFDTVGAGHGRVPAVASGIKRVQPDKLVFCLQGDGDMVAEGTAEVIHAAARGENITCFLVNNAAYGETGGHMAPTTLIGQRTKNSPRGRDPELDGYPLRIADMLAPLEGVAYVARVAVNSPSNVGKAHASIRKALEIQMSGAGFTLVEILSMCPTSWAITALESLKWIDENLIPAYPLGELKTPKGSSVAVGT